MVGAPLLRLALHSALGPWDEIITRIPVGIDGTLLPYHYFAARGRPAKSGH